MRCQRHTARLVLAAAIGTGLAGGLCAQDDVAPPLRLRATMMIVDSLAPGTAQVAVGGDGTNGMPVGAPGTPATPPMVPVPPTVSNPSATRSAPKTTAALMTITLNRVSTGDESAALVQALKSGGIYGLVSQMDRTTIGYVQLNDRLRLPIRVGSTWKTGKGQVIRLATSRPILDTPAAPASRGSDNSIGIIELTLPPTGAGEGTLVQAVRAGFDDQGRIVARTLALNTGTERLTNVERQTSDKGE